MEKRLYRLAWATAIVWLIVGVLYCKHLDEQFEWTRETVNWGSPKQRQLKIDCDAGVHSTLSDCFVNRQDEKNAQSADEKLGVLSDTMHAAGMWTVAGPLASLGAFFIGRWLRTGRWRAAPKSE